MQDDDGATDSGTVGAGRTLELLQRAIFALEGPRYSYRQIDPKDGEDGGRPGANIRVVLLFDPSRVRADFLDGPRGQIDLLVQSSGVTVRPNPARLEHPAFDRDEASGFGGSRKPLVTQVRFDGEDVIVINNHLSSKGGDDRLMGERQPPRRLSEERRIDQARAVRALVERLLEAEPGARIVVLGDMNEYLQRPPMRVLEGRLLTNLMEAVGVRDRYTFNYQGNSVLLDHVLVSRSLAGGGPQVDVVHANADFAASRRASDQYSVVVRLSFE